jgi:ATP-dependent helicase/DNAse subunit B
MAHLVAVEVGPARSGKTYRLLELYRSALREAAPAVGRTLWIAPTSRSAAAVREQLVAGRLDGCLAPGVVTFDELTDRVLAEAEARIRPISASCQRDLIRRLVAAATCREGGSSITAASSSGFVDLVVDHIRELKRRGIEPAAFAKAPSRRPSADEQRELAQIYGDYQQLLAKHRLADREGAIWIARDQLAAGRCPSLDQLKLVVVDGFTDFTPTQQEVLRLLAGRAEEMHVSLPGDDPNAGDRRRLELFAKANATLAELRLQLSAIEEHLHGQRPSNAPALDHISQKIFGDPRCKSLPLSAETNTHNNIEIVAAAGQQAEITEIARRIKRRLAIDAARPEDIVVVFRNLHQAAPRVREVFAEFGIPFALESTPPLIHAPLVRTLIGLLRLSLDDWPFRHVVATVTNNSLKALGDDARRASDWLVRDLQIAGGRQTLLDRVEQLAADALPPDQLSEHHERRVASARAAFPALTKLASALDELPERAGLTDWCKEFRQLGARLGLATFSKQPVENDACTAPSAVEDVAAWRSLARHFTDITHLDSQLGQSPRHLSHHELLQLVIDIATHESLPRPHDEIGRVRVLAAASVRTVTARHLYLAGMAEQAFPVPEPAGRLFSDDDYRCFQRIAYPVPAGQKQPELNRSQEEMLLFYEILTRAEQSLTISYPALDERAQSLPPSPYVTEIERLLGVEAGSTRRVVPLPSALPKDGVPLCPADWRLQAVDRALAGDAALLASVFTNGDHLAPAGPIEAGLRMVHTRGRRDEFGPGEGLLQSPAVAARLAGRFGPQHCWSTSQWEEYALCPYRFFLAHVLGLEPLGELALQTDFGRRGGLLHQVFANFHRDRPSGSQSAETSEQFLERLHGVLTSVVDAMPSAGIDAALVELDRRQIAKWAEKHFDHHHNYLAASAEWDQPLAPTHFELRFGPPRPGMCDDDDPDSVSDPFELDVGGETVRVGGRIDRVDVGRAGGRTVFSVVDYKTGKVRSLKEDEITSGQRLQLPIYVAAAQAMLFGGEATPVAAGYWTMEGGFDQRGALRVLQENVAAAGKCDKWEVLQSQVVQQIKQFVSGIRGGDFPVHSCDEHCTGRCDFNTVCRVAQVRALGKTWPPEEL